MQRIKFRKSFLKPKNSENFSNVMTIIKMPNDPRKSEHPSSSQHNGMLHHMWSHSLVCPGQQTDPQGQGNTERLPIFKLPRPFSHSDLPALCCDFTKRVARSMHTIKQPVTLGSRVPLWPVFSTRSIRRIQATTSWEEGLEGLSRLMKPVLDWERNYCVINSGPRMKTKFAE